MNHGGWTEDRCKQVSVPLLFKLLGHAFMLPDMHQWTKQTFHVALLKPLCASLGDEQLTRAHLALGGPERPRVVRPWPSSKHVQIPTWQTRSAMSAVGPLGAGPEGHIWNIMACGEWRLLVGLSVRVQSKVLRSKMAILVR